jgi:short subunit dehydrogenase-like uncharacterized protein
MDNRDPVILLLGATGYTGRLVAHELRATGVPFALSGRDADALARLGEELGGGVETHALDLASPAALGDILRPGDGVINCVGPFIDRGEAVIQACISARAHYVDVTGEQLFMWRVRERYREAAEEAGVTVANAMAFEYALGDCAIALAARGMKTPLRSIDVIYAWRNPASSRGTRRTALRMIGRRGRMLDRGRSVRSAQGARQRDVVLASGDPLRAVTFTSGEMLTVPEHVEVETLRGWAVVGAGTAALAPLVSPFLPLLLPIFRPFIEPFVTRRPDPDEAERASSRFTIRAELHDRTGVRRPVEVRGRDPYAVSAVVAVSGIRRALEPDAPRGVLAPSRLVDPHALFHALEPRGVRFIHNP